VNALLERPLELRRQVSERVELRLLLHAEQQKCEEQGKEAMLHSFARPAINCRQGEVSLAERPVPGNASNA